MNDDLIPLTRPPIPPGLEDILKDSWILKLEKPLENTNWPDSDIKAAP